MLGLSLKFLGPLVVSYFIYLAIDLWVTCNFSSSITSASSKSPSFDLAQTTRGWFQDSKEHPTQKNSQTSYIYLSVRRNVEVYDANIFWKIYPWIAKKWVLVLLYHNLCSTKIHKKQSVVPIQGGWFSTPHKPGNF